jgi:hypothetical protein
LPAVPPLTIPGVQASGSASAPTVPGAPANAKTVSPEEATITLTLTNVSLFELLHYVTNLAGLTIKVQPDGIWVKPIMSSGCYMMLTRAYRLPAAVCSTREQIDEIEKAINLIKIPNRKWDFDPKTRCLTIRTIDPDFYNFEHWYAAALMRYGYKFE